MIIISEDEKERILHGLIKGRIVYKLDEEERKITPSPMKKTRDGLIDPREIIKGRFTYAPQDKFGKLK